MPENKGYAYVRYRLDDSKTTVPLSFVLDWEPGNPVNTSKLFKVFWSNIEDDTPTSLARRVSEETHVIDSKDDPKYGQAGYYRVTIYYTAGNFSLFYLRYDAKL